MACSMFQQKMKKRLWGRIEAIFTGKVERQRQVPARIIPSFFNFRFSQFPVTVRVIKEASYADYFKGRQLFRGHWFIKT